MAWRSGIGERFGEAAAGVGKLDQGVGGEDGGFGVDHPDLFADQLFGGGVGRQEFDHLVFVADDDGARADALFEEVLEDVARGCLHVAHLFEVVGDAGQERGEVGGCRGFSVHHGGGEEAGPDVAGVGFRGVGREDLEAAVDVDAEVFFPARLARDQVADPGDVGDEHAVVAFADDPGGGQRIGDLGPGVEDDGGVEDGFVPLNRLAGVPGQFHGHGVRGPEAILAGVGQRGCHFDGAGFRGVERDLVAVFQDVPDPGVGEEGRFLSPEENRDVDRVAAFDGAGEAVEVDDGDGDGDRGDDADDQEAEEGSVHGVRPGRVAGRGRPPRPRARGGRFRCRRR